MIGHLWAEVLGRADTVAARLSCRSGAGARQPSADAAEIFTSVARCRWAYSLAHPPPWPVCETAARLGSEAILTWARDAGHPTPHACCIVAPGPLLPLLTRHQSSWSPDRSKPKIVACVGCDHAVVDQVVVLVTPPGVSPVTVVTNDGIDRCRRLLGRPQYEQRQCQHVVRIDACRQIETIDYRPLTLNCRQLAATVVICLPRWRAARPDIRGNIDTVVLGLGCDWQDIFPPEVVLESDDRLPLDQSASRLCGTNAVVDMGGPRVGRIVGWLVPGC